MYIHQYKLLFLKPLLTANWYKEKKYNLNLNLNIYNLNNYNYYKFFSQNLINYKP